MRRVCRECLSHSRGLAIPTCIMARAWRTCRDPCRGRLLTFRLKSVAGKTFPVFQAHAQPAILRIWQEDHVNGSALKAPPPPLPGWIPYNKEAEHWYIFFHAQAVKENSRFTGDFLTPMLRHCNADERLSMWMNEWMNKRIIIRSIDLSIYQSSKQYLPAQRACEAESTTHYAVLFVSLLHLKKDAALLRVHLDGFMLPMKPEICSW